MKRAILLLPAAVLLFSCSSGTGVPVEIARSKNPEQALVAHEKNRGDLFLFYEPTGKSRWKQNWTAQLDLTGVSWNDDRTATLIAPSFVVMAAHFVRPANVPVMFHDRHGHPYERFIDKCERIPGMDVAVAKLNLPLPPAIKAYPFASADAAKPGRSVILSDQDKRLFVHEIAAPAGKGVRFKFDQDLDPIFRKRLIPGDSGNPSFLLENGELHLLETHTTGGPGAGPCYANPEVQEAVRKAIAEMGG
ncbi:hypothetical protein JIN85_12250 [Luteolibacter pohnpeiensis]|uniref:Lipoprotein n=1 Tax=Luteolibacter pohnpeiensis TaxID=454153 RepID=A0A934VRG9_9BACT|nr:hypothetical protein [Luteolibacter pohnpeiensis]MBK1883191.1 hypothetical protein [Luteolibacter pohnpeiensis]